MNFEPKAQNINNLCFIVDTDLDQVIKQLNKLNINIEEGIVERTGAIEKIKSILY